MGWPKPDQRPCTISKPFSATISLDWYFRVAASAPVVRGEREDLFLRIGQVLDPAGQEGLGRGDHVQRLPHQLDQAVLGHETAANVRWRVRPVAFAVVWAMYSANTCSGVSIRTWVSSGLKAKSR